MLAPFMDDLDDNGKEPFEDINENCTYDEGEPFQDIILMNNGILVKSLMFIVITIQITIGLLFNGIMYQMARMMKIVQIV